MPIAELLLAGVQLLGLGMGIVFGFLLVLVFVLHGMSRLARALDSAYPTKVGATRAAGTSPPAPAADTELIAVISAAVARYRTRHAHRLPSANE